MNELYHHGIKGMRWGIRKDPTSIGSKKTSKNSAAKRAPKEASKSLDKRRTKAETRAHYDFKDRLGENALHIGSLTVASDILGRTLSGNFSGLIGDYTNPKKLVGKSLNVALNSMTKSALDMKVDKATLNRFKDDGTVKTGIEGRMAAAKEASARTSRTAGLVALNSGMALAKAVSNKQSNISPKVKEQNKNKVENTIEVMSVKKKALPSPTAKYLPIIDVDYKEL